MSTIPIDDKLVIGPDRANIDARYKASNNRPYTSVAAAEAAINLVIGNVGLTVLVADENDPDYPKAKEYWVQPKGTTPETYGLVEKGAGTTDYADLDNKPTISDGGQGSAQIPLSGNVKVTAKAATSEQTTGVAVTAGQNGEINIDFTLEKGTDGVNGKSAYQQWLDEGNTGDEVDFLNSLKAHVAGFQSVAYDSNAPTTIGGTASAIGSLSPSADTMDKIVLMPNSDGTATIMYATTATESEGTTTYAFSCIGELAIDTSNFLNTSRVDSTNLKNPTALQVAKATDVMGLAAKLEGVTASETKATMGNQISGYINGDGAPASVSAGSTTTYVVIPLNNAKSVRLLGSTNAGTGTNYTSYAFWNAATYVNSNTVVEAHNWDIREGSENYAKEYTLAVPNGATYIAVSLNPATNQPNFYCYLQSGESIGEMIDKVKYDADNVKLIPDVYGEYIGLNGLIKYNQNTGIKHVELKKGQKIVARLQRAADMDLAPCSTFTPDNSESYIVYAVSSSSRTNDETLLFEAPADGVLDLSFSYTLNNYYRIVEDLDLSNEMGGWLFPISAFGCNSISYFGQYSGQYLYNVVNSQNYTTIFYKIPYEFYNVQLFFKPNNASYSIARIIGFKDKKAIKTTVRGEGIRIDYTDVFGNSCVFLAKALNDGTIDEVAFVFQKQTGYEEEDYAAFALENKYCDLEKFSAISNVPRLIFENYYPVGTVISYQRRGNYKIVKDKPANTWGDANTLVPISLIDTTNIPLESSMAEIANVMNVISANVGATNSNWKNPYGGKLYSVEHAYNRTTAKDMVRLMIAATKYPELIATMGTEIANVHIFGEHDRDKTLKNNSWDKLNDAYTFLHGSDSVMPYSIVCVKPGATYASDSTDSRGNVGYATGLDGVSNTGYSMVGIAKINDKYIAFDATNISKTGTSSDHYTQGRLARARATIELLDACKAILEGGSASGSYSYLEKGAAAIVENPITPYCVINAAQNIEFLYTYNGDDLFQPASTSKLAGGLAILSVLSNLEEYHSIWDDNKELLNDSGSDATSQETHVAYAGDVESVRTSLYAMMLVSNGANTLSLARMAGEKIIRSKNRFLNLTLDE